MHVGEDALAFKVAAELGLRPELKYIFNEEAHSATFHSGIRFDCLRLQNSAPIESVHLLDHQPDVTYPLLLQISALTLDSCIAFKVECQLPSRFAPYSASGSRPEFRANVTIDIPKVGEKDPVLLGKHMKQLRLQLQLVGHSKCQCTFACATHEVQVGTFEELAAVLLMPAC